MLIEYRSETELSSGESRSIQEKLTLRQLQLRGAGLPVVVLVEGWAAAGKGGLINQLISRTDPRYARVFSLDSARDKDGRYPYLYPFFCALPARGEILFMDSGWMEEAVGLLLTGRIDRSEFRRMEESVRRFERQLRDSGCLLIKLFVDIGRREQRERLERLCADPDSAWRVTGADLRQNREYRRWRDAYRDFMEEGEEDSTPWYLLDGSDKKSLYADAFTLITAAIGASLEAGGPSGAGGSTEFALTEPPRPEDCDLSRSLSPEAYKTELRTLQKKIARLHDRIYCRRIPMVLVFEGWDAAGKGGVIRRLAYPLDPRGFTVYPIAAPEPYEAARHYLWRFWKKLPRSGHVAIFDRSWYSRVLTERVEGLCREEEWQRAYCEINEFEEELTASGTLLMKFWLQIDGDTQLRRFRLREASPEKQWKITAEDWARREKRPRYEEALGEMLEKCSTESAPWHIIGANDKRYARIEVLRLVSEAMEQALES